MVIEKRRMGLSSSKIKGKGARSIGGVKIGDINAGLRDNVICDVVKAGMGCNSIISRLGSRATRPQALKQIKSLMKKAGY